MIIVKVILGVIAIFFGGWGIWQSYVEIISESPVPISPSLFLSILITDMPMVLLTVLIILSQT